MQVTVMTPLFVSAMSRAAPIFTRPKLDDDETEDMRTLVHGWHARDAEDPAVVSHDAARASVFPAPHPYGVAISGLPPRSSFRAPARAPVAVSDAALRAFRDAHVGADHISVACAGDLNQALVLRALENTLGKLTAHAKSPAPAPLLPAPPPRRERRVVVVDRPGSMQSSITIAWPGPPASSLDLVALDVLASATAGSLSTRLNITVRKELGATYGVHMTAEHMRDGGIINVAAAIDTERTAQALAGIVSELARLRTDPLTPNELLAAKLRTRLDLDASSNRGIARYLAHALAEGHSTSLVAEHDTRVEAVTAQEVRATAERWLTDRDAHVVVVGDVARITQGLQGLGLGDIVVLGAR